ncbi:hypothetical protein [Wenjunlia tyrosinilytica]|uniref:Lipoprotein CseA n=1 Tax=Wenjunlia tyrosinilytica TaxID=1544741 RepID=A0A917ZSR7_9ACTN|nr:hypothetical protein [Wenjunlia tyrosinilytica]GGO89588.1 lipoprotein CseA [Wenjunlia tyrosinilytica]
MKPRAQSMLTALTILAIGACVAMIGCARSDTIRIEGSAPSAAKVAGTPAAEDSGTGAPEVNVVSLLRADPHVREKKELRACSPEDGGTYPVEASYAALTGKESTDLVVNVSTCTDGVGVGSYVYRAVGSRYVNVFADEQPPVWAQASGRQLEVTRQDYGASDPVDQPSGETVTTYEWNDGMFEKIGSTSTDYGK